MEEEEESQPSGVLSPRRIEAIHIAFNQVFDQAKKDGLIRDPSTYKSFDDVFDMAMKRQNRKSIEDDVLEKGGEEAWEDVLEEERAVSETASRGKRSGYGSSKSPEIGKGGGNLFSDDEEYEQVRRPVQRPAERRTSLPKRSIEEVESIVTIHDEILTIDSHDPTNYKKPKKIRHPEPSIYTNRSPLLHAF